MPKGKVEVMVEGGMAAAPDFPGYFFGNWIN